MAMRQLLLFFFVFIHWGLSAQPKQEIRAAWLTTNYALDWPSKPVHQTTDILQQQTELSRILDQLKAAHFNVVFFQTRIRGNVIYPSKIEPWSHFLNGNRLKNPGYDPLEFVIRACHQRGLECHIWFVTYPLGLEKINGKKNQSPVVVKNKSLVKRNQGELYLDPGNPQTSVYLLSLVKEIVSQYDIDGFHFDYVRYPEKADRFPDQDTYRKYGQKRDLSTWRRENINRFIYAAYDSIKAMKPWVQVSSSVLGMYQKIPGNTSAHWTAYSSVFQDPADWLKKGKHDFIVPMMYYPDHLFYPFVGNWQEHSSDRFVVPGIGLYRMDDKEGGWNIGRIIDQVAYSRSLHTQGNAFYRTQQLIENKKGVMDTLRNHFYQFPAQLPPLVWLDSVAPSIPSQPEAIQQGDSLYLRWNNSTDTAEKIYYSIYCSDRFPVDTQDPKNLIDTRVYNEEYVLPVDRNKEKGYFYLITTSDRYHNESQGSPVVFFYMGSLEK